MRRKPNIRYVDMCIYVDNNIGKPDADVNKIYDYLTMISYMLAIKKNLFNSEDYYDRYAHYIASSVYMRMTSNKPGVEPVKSCLNYIKSIITKRKVNFEKAEYEFTTKSNSIESSVLRESTNYAARNSIMPFASIDICDYFQNIHNIIYDEIMKGPYKNDYNLV